MENKIMQFVRFGIVGGSTAVVDLCVLYFLTEYLHIDYLVSATLAYALAILINYSLQKWWVFANPDTQKMARQFGIFLTLALANLLVNAGLMYVLVESGGWHHMLSQALIVMVLALVNFTLYRLIFRNTVYT